LLPFPFYSLLFCSFLEFLQDSIVSRESPHHSAHHALLDTAAHQDRRQQLDRILARLVFIVSRTVPMSLPQLGIVFEVSDFLDLS
jgi:hypothetical protein